MSSMFLQQQLPTDSSPFSFQGRALIELKGVVGDCMFGFDALHPELKLWAANTVDFSLQERTRYLIGVIGIQAINIGNTHAKYQPDSPLGGHLTIPLLQEGHIATSGNNNSLELHTKVFRPNHGGYQPTPVLIKVLNANAIQFSGRTIEIRPDLEYEDSNHLECTQRASRFIHDLGEKLQVCSWYEKFAPSLVGD